MRRFGKFWFPLLVLFLMSVAFLIGCANRSALLPAPTQLREHGTLSKDADISGMERGRALFVTECATCHRTYWPREYPPAAWQGIVRDMGRRASLSSDQVKDLEAYLVESARLAQKAEE